jgi:transposase
MPELKKSVRQHRRQRREITTQDWTLGLEVVHPRAAGIDVGAGEHYVAVPPHCDPEGKPVRSFQTFTADLNRLADWLQRCGITTVAMQTTGVYWIPLYDVLERRGIQVFVVNARHTRNLPGRKSDVQECQWLLQLHVYGLLRNSFRPAEEVRILRAYWRLRQEHIGEAATSIQRMQKALIQMNVQLPNVLNDISGVTGMAIIRAIVDGERDPQELASFRDPNVKASQAEIAQHLEGTWREEHLFALKQQLANYDHYQQMIRDCDTQLHRHLQTFDDKGDPKDLPPVERAKRARGLMPEDFDLRAELFRISGVDLTRIDGINALTAQTVLAEIGPDLSRFPTEGQFVSFLGLCPDNRVSGGKILRSGTRKVKHRAATALRLAARSLYKSKSYLGARYRRLRARLGAPKAITAMAHVLARIIYRMLKYGEKYVDRGAQYYEERLREQQLTALTRQAAHLGMTLVPQVAKA